MNFSASNDYSGDGRFAQHSVIIQHIDKLELGPEDTVLDVGCGTGEETKSIARRVESVTAIDASEEMLAVAVKTNSAPNITYSQCDARAVGDNPDWREKFNKVVCFFVLHWIPEDEQTKALRSISACLKPGGQALFIIDNQDDTFVLTEAASFLKKHARWGAYVKGFKSSLLMWTKSKQETKDIFKECGWSKVICEVRSHNSMLSEIQTKLLLKTCLGETSFIPVAALHDFLQDLWQWAALVYEDKSQPGHAHIRATFMVVHAFK